MEAEEESPTYLAPPSNSSNNGAAELKRSSRGTWVQHWEQLERTYFRPLSAADLEDLSAQLRSLEEMEQMIADAKASSVCKSRDAGDTLIVAEIQAARVKARREEEPGLVPPSQGKEEEEEVEAGSVRSQSQQQQEAAHLQSQGPPSDSSASTSSCSVSDKENKAKRRKRRRADGAGDESVCSQGQGETPQRKGSSNGTKKKGLVRADSLVSIMEEDGDEGVDEDEDAEETRSAFSRDDDEEEDEEDEEEDEEVAEENGEEETQERSIAGWDGGALARREGGGGAEIGGGLAVEEEEDVDFAREIAYIARRKEGLLQFLQREIAHLLHYSQVEGAAGGRSVSSGSSADQQERHHHHHHNHHHHHRHQHEQDPLEVARQMEMLLLGGSQWQSDEATCELYRLLYR